MIRLQSNAVVFFCALSEIGGFMIRIKHVENKEEKVELSLELFDSETLLLDFFDITLGLESEDVRTYYNELTSNLDNFELVLDKRFVPSSSIVELRYQETATSICFYNVF